MEYLIFKLQNCTKDCIICDSPLDFQMVKPTVCERKLCLFSHEQYGLGADVASTITHYPDLVDLLISLTSAAALGDVRRFTPFPEVIEVKYQDQGGKIESLSFLENGLPAPNK